MTDYPGFQETATTGSDYNAHTFLVEQLMGRMATATIVTVVAVGAGTVDVVPAVNQMDRNGKPVPHGKIHGLPFVRLQGGANAVILDPAVGDMGVAVFASRDISSVTRTKRQANPGSHRRFDQSDGMYIAGLAALNGTPTQTVRFAPGGITLTSPVAVAIVAPQITLTGNLTNNGKSVGDTHVHVGVQPGAGLSGVPA